MTDFVPPWVKYDTPEAVPPVPVTSSTAAPAGLSWAAQLEQAAVDAAQTALTDAAPKIQDQVAKYTQDYITGILTGTPPASPTIVGTTLSGTDLVIASAKSRSWRTFVAGMGLDIVFALVAVVGTLSHVNFFTQAGWITFGVLIIKTVIQTVISYIARLKIAPPYEPK
jgi:hypothetical protein